MSKRNADTQYRWLSSKRKMEKTLSDLDDEHGSQAGEDESELSDVSETCQFPSDAFTCVAANVCLLEERGDTAFQTEDTNSNSSDEGAYSNNEYANWLPVSGDDTDDSFLSESDDEMDHVGLGDSESFRRGLAEWACECNVTHSQLNKLLKLHRKYKFRVPATATTLLKTPEKIHVQEKSGGEYVYFGLEKCVNVALSDTCADSLTEIEISVNIDGVPLFKNSHISFWPILCNIPNVVETPFIVALYSGEMKPQNLEFLDDFVDELKILQEKGIVFKGKTLPIKLRCVVCDAPAKALVKGTIQYNGRYGCDRCEEKGVWDGRMMFLGANAARRTDESFREARNAEHHKQESPFCKLNIDMIENFPLDYMHVVNLGVTRRLLAMWLQGKQESHLSSQQKECISMKLLQMRPHIPKEFARKPRTLLDVKLWKATEYRMFLIYTGPLALKGVIQKKYYDHFMCLSIGISILLNEALVKAYRNYAKELLEYFVSQSRVLYGDQFVTYNVHSIIHLPDVAAHFGSLQNCCAYPFENYLQCVKRLVRSGNKPLSQVARRIAENDANRVAKAETPVISVLSSKIPNNCYLLASGSYCLVKDIVSDEKLVCEVFEKTERLFKKPCNSRMLGIEKAKRHKSVIKEIQRVDLRQKAICIPLEDAMVALIPFLHTI